MSRHRSDLAKPRTAFDFDVVSDPPRPFKVRPGVSAEVPAEAPPVTPADPPAARDRRGEQAVTPHSDTGFDFGNT